MKIRLSYLIVIAVVCLLQIVVGCSKEDNNDFISISDIIGSWETPSATNDVFVFEDDGNGYSVVNKIKESFTWSFFEETLIISYGDDSVYHIDINMSTSSLSMEFEGQVYSKGYVSSNDKTDKQNSDYDERLIGEWWEGSVLNKLNSYYFCKGGKGYLVCSKKDKDYGVKYYPFIWNTHEIGVLEIKYKEFSSPDMYSYEIVDNKLKLVDGGKNYEWRKMSDNADENFDADGVPFSNNYLKNKITDYYYEITKVVSGCRHAGTGDNMNEKYIQFFGSTGNILTTGLQITYHTPRYDGINSTWSNGTYTMRGPGAYLYSATAWCNGAKLYTYDGAKFKISKSGSFVIYDYTDEDVELHVVVSTN